jgi:hypothetical protein
MPLETVPGGSDQSVYDILSRALAAIPVPITVKDRPRAEQVIERTVIRQIAWDELAEVAYLRKTDLKQVLGALVVLEALGIIIFERATGTLRISTTSESAGYLLHSLGKHLASLPGAKSPLRPDSSIREFRSVIESAIHRNQIDPHLIIANILESSRQNAKQEPLRSARVISVLIKARRARSNCPKGTEEVYLHVKKPQWDSYALIGSVQNPGESDLETAQLALEEDLETSASAFDLRPSGVDDEYDTNLSINRGAITRYAFNLYYVTALHGNLGFRDDLEYAWFTFDEICHQESSTGQPIMTKAILLRRLDDNSVLGRVPALPTNTKPFLAKSLRSQARDALGATRDVARELGELIQLLWTKLLPVKWWLLLLMTTILAAVILRPIIGGKNIPALSNTADILSILGYAISGIGVVHGLSKRR